jgi:hypothetical protein
LDIWVTRFPYDENTRAFALSLCNELVRIGRFEVARWVLESSRDLAAPISAEARQHELDLERRIEAKSR